MSASKEFKCPSHSALLSTLLTGAESYSCPFCGGHTALNAEEQTVLHEEPQCEGFGELMATVESFPEAVAALERVREALESGRESVLLTSSGQWRLPGGELGSCNHCGAVVAVKLAAGLISHAYPVCSKFREQARLARTIHDSVARNFSTEATRDN